MSGPAHGLVENLKLDVTKHQLRLLIEALGYAELATAEYRDEHIRWVARYSGDDAAARARRQQERRHRQFERMSDWLKKVRTS